MKYKEHGDAHRGHPQGSSREGTGSPGAGTPVARHSRDAVLFSRTARSTSLGSMFGGTATRHAWPSALCSPNPNQLHSTHQSPFWEGTAALHGATAASKSAKRFFFSAPCLVSHPAPSASRPARPPLRGWLRHRCRHLHRSGQPSRSRGRREGSQLALVACNPPSSAPAAPGLGFSSGAWCPCAPGDADPSTAPPCPGQGSVPPHGTAVSAQTPP